MTKAGRYALRQMNRVTKRGAPRWQAIIHGTIITVMANTKSEARTMMKQDMETGRFIRIPPGTRIVRLPHD